MHTSREFAGGGTMRRRKNFKNSIVLLLLVLAIHNLQRGLRTNARIRPMSIDRKRLRGFDGGTSSERSERCVGVVRISPFGAGGDGFSAVGGRVCPSGEIVQPHVMMTGVVVMMVWMWIEGGGCGNVPPEELKLFQDGISFAVE